MKAIQFNLSIPRYALGLALSKLYYPVLWSGLSCTSMKDIAEPDLPGPEWVKIRTRLAGICGTDTSTIGLKTSPYFSPFSESPFTMGHENVGDIVEVGAAAGEWAVGQRVVVNPFLWCATRGYAEADWCAPCQRGENNLCQHYAEGGLRPAIFMGSSRDTGGSWSAFFCAHKANVYAVPENVSDENALMVEPFACGLHAALMDFPANDETILILGAGTIGLVQLAALRVLGSRARILVSARYDFQAEAAHRLGADEVLLGGDLYTEVAERTGARLYKPLIGKRVVVGGVDRTYECVGSDGALDDAMRLTRAGGTVMVVGMPGLVKGVDWTAIFSQELKVRAAIGYNHAEMYQGAAHRAFQLTLDLMAAGKLDLGGLVNRRYRLEDYKRALHEQEAKRRHPIVKAVFDFPI